MPARPFVFLAALAVLAIASTGSGSAASVEHEGATKKVPPTIVVKSFRFVGFDKDVVGRFRSVTPDGQPDGHFRVVLVRPQRAQPNGHFMISRCPSKPTNVHFSVAGYKVGDLGCEGSRRLASTFVPPPNQVQPAALAVFSDGKRLTVPQRGGVGVRVPKSSKGIRFDLYVNGGPGCPMQTPYKHGPDCRAAFAPGQRYLFMVMTVTPAGSDWISRPGDKVPQVTSPQAELRNLRFVGLDKDVAGRGGGSAPDGKPDAHWTVEVATPAGPRFLAPITLERIRADTDRPDQPGAWCAPGCPGAGPGNPAVAELYVSLNGERVLVPVPNAGPLELPYTTAGVQLDLYAVDVAPSVFTAGQRFRVTVLINPEYVDPRLGFDATQALPKFTVSTPWLTLP